MTTDKISEPFLVCSDPHAWHIWLAGHHDQKEGIWLQIRKAGSQGGGVTLSEAVIEAIRFGWIDGRMRSRDADSYILHFTPRRPAGLWSKINRQRAETLIAEGKMTEAGMAMIRAAKARGTWQAAYTSKEKPSLPDDLTAALASDPAILRHFSCWPNSAQMQAVYWIEAARRPETRRKRIDEVVIRAREWHNQ